jgi:hypothetical protein
MNPTRYRQSRFDLDEGDGLGPLANMADIMLVFAVGLMVALAAAKGGIEGMAGGVSVETGRELPEVPVGKGQGGSGMESVGRVYRDPETGKLIMIENGGERK